MDTVQNNGFNSLIVVLVTYVTRIMRIKFHNLITVAVLLITVYCTYGYTIQEWRLKKNLPPSNVFQETYE
jgi:hypothetical protein